MIACFFLARLVHSLMRKLKRDLSFWKQSAGQWMLISVSSNRQASSWKQFSEARSQITLFPWSQSACFYKETYHTMGSLLLFLFSDKNHLIRSLTTDSFFQGYELLHQMEPFINQVWYSFLIQAIVKGISVFNWIFMAGVGLCTPV